METHRRSTLQRFDSPSWSLLTVIYVQLISWRAEIEHRGSMIRSQRRKHLQMWAASRDECKKVISTGQVNTTTHVVLCEIMVGQCLEM